MRVLHVCSELFPVLKTGGLADVAGALPLALNNFDCESRVLVPGFPAFMNLNGDKYLVAELGAMFGAASVNLYFTKLENGIELYIIDAPELFDRLGNPYADSNNQAYTDNYRRFALLGFLAMKLADNLDPHWRAELIHGHDWHAGLASVYLKAEEIRRGHKLAGSVFTVHNLAYQGVFPPHVFGELQLPEWFFNMHGIEFHNQVSFLKAGLYFSDKITTVSPSYAHEIQGDEQGCGLNGLLQSRSQDLVGILNGIDLEVWSPSADKLLAANYTTRNMTGKAKCKMALQEYSGLEVQVDKPLFAIVSRLTEQKGLNLVLAGAGEIISRGGQVVILGSGDAELERGFKELAAQYPASFAVQLGYDENHAHRIVAGSDVIMVPSRFEPCGLTQLYGLHYGTLPLVRKVGGLADTVVDCSLENLADGSASGFVFDDFNVVGFTAAVKRAFALYERKADWKKVQKYTMQQSLGWDSSAAKYYQLYQQVIG